MNIKKIIKRFSSTLFALIFFLTILSGCSNSESTSNKNPSVKDIGSKIEQAINMDDMVSSDINRFKKFYKVNTDDIEDLCFYAPKSNLKASQIAIIKVKDADKVDDIKDKISQYLDEQSESFKTYLPDEYFLLEHKVLKVKDNYILLDVSKDADEVEKIFDDSFK